jgi:hypothetical protein
MIYINCVADNCNTGWLNGALCNLINCYAHDNSVAGFNCHDHNEFFGCVIRDNGKGILTDSGTKIHRCLLYNNTTHNVHITGAFTPDPTHITDSIIDGNGISTYGVYGFRYSYQGSLKILNSMVINCSGVGVYNSGDDGEWNVNCGLLMNGNGTDFINYAGQYGLVSGIPTFVNEGTDWTPASDSAAIIAGWDLRNNQFATVTGALPTIGGIEPVGNSAADYPSEDDVRDGVLFDSSAQSGNLILPDMDHVLNDTSYGTSGVEFNGIYDAPSDEDVRVGTTFGPTGSEISGTLVIPLETDVRNGIPFGAESIEFSGSLTLPSPDDVRDGIEFGAP